MKCSLEVIFQESYMLVPIQKYVCQKQADLQLLHCLSILSAIGVGLQTAGGICLFVAALGIGKEINQQIRKTIIKELSKQVSDN